MKKLLVPAIILVAIVHFLTNPATKKPPTAAIESNYRCIWMQGYQGDTNWGSVPGDGWHEGKLEKTKSEYGYQYWYTIPYRARITAFKFERGETIKSKSGPSLNGEYFKVKLYRRIQRDYKPGNVDPETLERLLPKEEIFNKTVYFYEYLNGTWRAVENL